MPSPKLKPCPLCASKASLFSPYVNEIVLGHHVGCTNKKCGCTTKMFKTQEEAVAAWNRRAGEEGK